MSTVRFTKDHEWISVEGNVGTVGITDYAQSQLGDVVYVELPEVGKKVAKSGEAAVVESVKAASEIYAPVSGEVMEVNSALDGAPATVNEDAQGRGWFLKMKIDDAAELEGLMTEEQYTDFSRASTDRRRYGPYLSRNGVGGGEGSAFADQRYSRGHVWRFDEASKYQPRLRRCMCRSARSPLRSTRKKLLSPRFRAAICCFPAFRCAQEIRCRALRRSGRR